MNWKIEERITLLQNRWEDAIQSLGQTHSCSLLCCLPWESLLHHLFCWCSGKTKTYSWSQFVYWLLCRNGNGREGAESDLPAPNKGNYWTTEEPFLSALTNPQPLNQSTSLRALELMLFLGDSKGGLHILHSFYFLLMWFIPCSH